MVKPTYPGVYVVEDPSSVHTITPVATSIAAFFGRTSKGPVNKAVRLHSMADFYKTFGPAIANSQLAMSVQLFFQNGGTDCYVVRVMDDTLASQASITLKNVLQDRDVLQFQAKEVGLQGNQLALVVDYNTPSPEDTFNLMIYRIGSDGTIIASEEFLNCSMDWNSPTFTPDFITQNSKLVNCSLPPATYSSLSDYQSAVNGHSNCYSRSGRFFDTVVDAWPQAFVENIHSKRYFYFTINIDGTRYPIDLSHLTDHPPADEPQLIAAIENQILGSSINVEFSTTTTTNIKSLVFRLPASSNKNSITIEPGSTDDASQGLMLGTENGGIEVSRTSDFRPAPNGIFFDLSHLVDIATTKQENPTQITLDSEPPVTVKVITTNDADPWYKGKNGSETNYDGVREKMGIIVNTIKEELTDWDAFVSGYRLCFNKKTLVKNSTYDISTSSDSHPTDPNLGTLFQKNTSVYALGMTSGPYVTTSSLGQDGGPPRIEDFEGNSVSHTGFYALDKIDLFNLMVIPYDDNLPPDYESLWAPASTYCKSKRAFLIIEPPADWKSNNNVLDPVNGIRKLRRGVARDYAAVYYPRLVMPGPNGLKTTINPGGAIAGIMARTDAAVGVWKAPAGLDAGIQGGNFDLDILLTDQENGDLNPEGVNCVRGFPEGLVCWGARTLDGADDFGSQWKYVPIRRLALMIEESLYRGTKWVVFQPNDEPLWAKIRLNVDAFMMELFRQGAFQGSTPNKAFFVKCDHDNNPQENIDQGIVTITVGFAPLKPAEFVIIHIQQMQGAL